MYQISNFVNSELQLKTLNGYTTKTNSAFWSVLSIQTAFSFTTDLIIYL